MKKNGNFSGGISGVLMTMVSVNERDAMTQEVMKRGLMKRNKHEDRLKRRKPTDKNKNTGNEQKTDRKTDRL